MHFRLSPDAALQDLQLGVRSLRKHPIVTGIAIVTLTLGIGVSTGIFALVNACRLPIGCGHPLGNQ
jgi:hypothetical protein